MRKGEVYKTKRIDAIYGKTRIVGTVEWVHDPEAVQAGFDFAERCLLHRLPYLIGNER